MSKKKCDLAGAAVALTGGANGIGRATVQELHRRGARITVGDLDIEAAERVAAELGNNVVPVKLDVSDVESYKSFLDAAESAHGPLDVVVNNAGIDWIGPFLDKPLEAAAKEIAVNLMGTTIGSQLALQRMVPRRRGHVVNVASANGRLPGPGSSGYTATKYGIVGLTESLRLEFRNSGVQFSLIHPGQIDTAMLSGTARPSKLVPVIGPDQVGRAIADAVEHQRFDVWVPANTAIGGRLGNVVPRAFYEQTLLALGVDKIALDVDLDARRNYHDRMFGDTQ